jgi:hypothetical protein
MKDFKTRPRSGTEVTVRNCWLRGVISENGAKPDHVLLDVGIFREQMEWNSVSLTPARARRVAAALLKAAAEVEGTP